MNGLADVLKVLKVFALFGSVDTQQFSFCSARHTFLQLIQLYVVSRLDTPTMLAESALVLSEFSSYEHTSRRSSIPLPDAPNRGKVSSESSVGMADNCNPLALACNGITPCFKALSQVLQTYTLLVSQT